MISTFYKAAKFYKNWRKCVGQAPHYVELLVTTQCNLKCVMCNVWKLRIKKPLIEKDEMSIFQSKELLHALQCMGTRVVYLSGGEPLLKSGILSLIQAAKKEKLRVGLFTNGTIITPALAHSLLDSCLDHIIFSIDSPRASVHDQIRGVNGTWEKAVRGMQILSTLRNELNASLRISINMLITRTNYHLIEEMIDCKPLWGYDDIEFLPLINRTSASKNFLLTQENLKNLSKRLPIIKRKLRYQKLSLHILSSLISICHAANKSEKGNYGLYTLPLPEDLKSNVLCFAPWNMATIDPFGNVYPCCYACAFQNLSNDLTYARWGKEDFSMGNVRNEPFEKIWNGSEFRKFRERCQHPPVFPMCEACGYDFSRNVVLTGLFKNKGLLLRYVSYALSRRINNVKKI